MFSLTASQDKVTRLNRPVRGFCLGALLVGSVEAAWRAFIAPHPYDKFTGYLGLLLGLYVLAIGTALASALFGAGVLLRERVGAVELAQPRVLAAFLSGALYLSGCVLLSSAEEALFFIYGAGAPLLLGFLLTLRAPARRLPCGS